MTASLTGHGEPSNQRVRVGVDLCEVADVRTAMERFGDRYLCAVYTPNEIATAGFGPARYQRLAASFAAKEASLKALGPADTGIDLRSIEVVADGSGSNRVTLRGAAAVLAAASGVATIRLSMSHGRGVACAVAIAEPQPTEPPAETGENE